MGSYYGSETPLSKSLGEATSSFALFCTLQGFSVIGAPIFLRIPFFCQSVCSCEFYELNLRRLNFLIGRYEFFVYNKR